MTDSNRHSGSATHRGTADMLKERFDWLESFSDFELKQISYCTKGEPMKRDEEYFDISHPERGIIRGHQGGEIPDGACYVPRSEVPQELWHKLTQPFS